MALATAAIAALGLDAGVTELTELTTDGLAVVVVVVVDEDPLVEVVLVVLSAPLVLPATVVAAVPAVAAVAAFELDVVVLVADPDVSLVEALVVAVFVAAGELAALALGEVAAAPGAPAGPAAGAFEADVPAAVVPVGADASLLDDLLVVLSAAAAVFGAVAPEAPEVRGVAEEPVAPDVPDLPVLPAPPEVLDGPEGAAAGATGAAAAFDAGALLVVLLLLAVVEASLALVVAGRGFAVSDELEDVVAWVLDVDEVVLAPVAAVRLPVVDRLLAVTGDVCFELSVRLVAADVDCLDALDSVLFEVVLELAAAVVEVVVECESGEADSTLGNHANGPNTIAIATSVANDMYSHRRLAAVIQRARNPTCIRCS